MKPLLFWCAAVLVFAAISLGGVWIAFAQDATPTGITMSVSPPKQELVLSPGEKAQSSVSIANLSGQSINIHTTLMDFQVVDTGGTVTLNPPNPANPLGAGSDVTLLAPPDFSLAPNERRDIAYRVAVPSDASGGSRYGAIVFESGPPPQPGKVSIVSEVASLLLVRVRGAFLTNLLASKTTVVLSFPLQCVAGNKITQLTDPETKLQIQTLTDTAIVLMPVNDHLGQQQGTMAATSTSGVTCTGSTAVAKSDVLRVNSNTWQAAATDTGGSGVTIAQVQVAFEMKSLPQRGELNVAVDPSVDSQMLGAFQTAAGSVATVQDVAFIVRVAKRNVQDDLHIINAHITLRVPRAWVEKNDPALVRVVRYADDGSLQVLDTVYQGIDGDFATFEATSPGGLSVFGLVAFDHSVGPVSLPAGTLPNPAVAVTPGAPNTFTMLLSPVVNFSPSMTATDNQGQAVQAAPGGGMSINTEVQPPPIPDVNLTLASLRTSGTLKWLRKPKIVLAGSNAITLRFSNTGNTDYEITTGLAQVVKMNGAVAAKILVPDFNAFPGASHDVGLDWVTPANAFGRYTLAAQVSFGDPSLVAVSGPLSVWVVPWKWVLSILLVGGGLLGGAWLLLRSMRQYVEKQVERRVTTAQGAGDAADTTKEDPSHG